MDFVDELLEQALSLYSVRAALAQSAYFGRIPGDRLVARSDADPD